MALGRRRRRHHRRHLRDLFDFDDLGRRHRRHRRRHLFGLGGPRFASNLKDVAIGIASAAGGLLAWNFTGGKLLATQPPYLQFGVPLALGAVGGAAVARANSPLGIGLGAGLGGAGLLGAVMAGVDAIVHRVNVAPAATHGIDAYTWSRRYGMHGLGQPKPTYYGWGVGQTEPGAYRLHGLGRTRVTDMPPPGIVLNAFPYSRRYGMRGLGWSYHSSAVPGVHG